MGQKLGKVFANSAMAKFIKYECAEALKFLIRDCKLAIIQHTFDTPVD